MGLLGHGPQDPIAAPSAVALPDDRAGFDAGFALINEETLTTDLTILASPVHEGRDSPSAGLTAAAEHVASRLKAAGYEGAGEKGSFRVGFERMLPNPVPDECHLVGIDEQELEHEFKLGEDFVPLWNASGSAEGEAVFVTFGIDSQPDKYDDIRGDLEDTIAVILSGEPNHKRKFDGFDISPAANTYDKLPALAEAGVIGVLVVRRPPPVPEPPKSSRSSRRGRGEPEAAPAPAAPPMGFRHTWASFNDGTRPRRYMPAELPVLEITPAVAQALLGLDVLEVAKAVDKSVKAPKPVHTGMRVEMSSQCEVKLVRIDNVVGLLRGSDPALANEVVVIGAHYDHIGVDARGRVGLGADDNGSGTAALLSIADALATARPRRTILVAAFAAEEDDLLGSKALVNECPVPIDSIAAMVNLDMIGFGKDSEVVVIGVPENPDLGKLLKRAKKLEKSGIRKIVTGQGQELMTRSDHYPFHKAGIPTLFFFEGLPIDKNADYHRWTDTIDIVDMKKVANTARLVFNVCWLLATEDERPDPPKGSR
jgi:hypothetical protein